MEHTMYAIYLDSKDQANNQCSLCKLFRVPGSTVFRK